MDPWVERILIAAVSIFLAFILPKLVFKGSADINDRITKLEAKAFTTPEEKTDFYNRMKAAEMRIEFIRENQKDFQDSVEQSFMDAVKDGRRK